MMERALKLLLFLCWMDKTCYSLCNDGFYLDGQDCKPCPSGTYLDKSLHTKTSCTSWTNKPFGPPKLNTATPTALTSSPAADVSNSSGLPGCGIALIVILVLVAVVGCVVGYRKRKRIMGFCDNDKTPREEEGDGNTHPLIRNGQDGIDQVSETNGDASDHVSETNRDASDHVSETNGDASDRVYETNGDVSDNEITSKQPSDGNTNQTQNSSIHPRVEPKSKQGHMYDQSQGTSKDNQQGFNSGLADQSDPNTSCQTESLCDKEKIGNNPAIRQASVGDNDTNMKHTLFNKNGKRNYYNLVKVMREVLSYNELYQLFGKCNIQIVQEKDANDSQFVDCIHKWESTNPQLDILDVLRKNGFKHHVDCFDSRDYIKIERELKGQDPLEDFPVEGELTDLGLIYKIFVEIFTKTDESQYFLNMLESRADAPFNVYNFLNNCKNQPPSNYICCGIKWVRWHRGWDHIACITKSLQMIGSNDVLDGETFKGLIEESERQRK